MSGLPVENLVLDAARSVHRAHRATFAGDPRPRPMGEGLDLTGVRRDGREVPVEISLSSLPTEDGVVVLAAVRDISERLAAEAERERLRAEAEQERFERRQQESQRLESLGQLVGGVAHDFNNLLNIIGGYTDFVAEQVAGLTEEDKRLQPVLADIKQVREATQRAARLTRQLLIFARRDVVHPEVLDVNGVVSGVEQLLRRTLGEHIGTWSLSPPRIVDGQGRRWPARAGSRQPSRELPRRDAGWRESRRSTPVTSSWTRSTRTGGLTWRRAGTCRCVSRTPAWA